MKSASLFVAGALIAGSLLAQGVKDVDKEWIKAAKAGDAAKMSMLYATDAVMYPPDELAVKGREAIRASYAKLFSEMKVADMVLDYAVFKTTGDTSWASGRFSMRLEPKAGGAGQSIEGRFTSVAERQGGKWLYVSDHASVPTPPHAPARAATPAPAPTPK